MIFYVATERFSSTIRRFLKHHGKALGGCLTSLTWEELFFERAGPVGHYIFTDFDRLSRYELDCAAAFALALEKTTPDARVLNHPLRALERFPLLAKLYEAGINDFTVTRLESGGRPPKYPAFIRAEDGYGGAEIDLVHDDTEFDSALVDMRRRGLPLRGRVAIGYAAERSPNGMFKKFGAFNIGGSILPHHLMYGRTWVVKSHVNETDWIKRRDDQYRFTAGAVMEEMEYVRNNPHQKVLAQAFALAGIDFGRADYGVVDGRVQVYEINTNPSLPGPVRSDPRSDRRSMVQRGMIDAFKKLATPLGAAGRIHIAEARPRAHNLHLPRWRLPFSLFRRTQDFLTWPKR